MRSMAGQQMAFLMLHLDKCDIHSTGYKSKSGLLAPVNSMQVQEDNYFYVLPRAERVFHTNAIYFILHVQNNAEHNGSTRSIYKIFQQNPI